MSKNDNDRSLKFKILSGLLNEMQEHPETVTDEDRSALKKIHSALCKALGISEHLDWKIEWIVDKWHSTADMLAGVAPYETVRDSQNIVLDSGANEILKLISGTGGTAFNNANARIVVGNVATAENATQTGVLATGSNRAEAVMDSGYPQVSGRTVTYRATFGEGAAKFDWREACILNGSISNSGTIAMNRKVSNMGTKEEGTWTMQIVITLLST